MTNPTSSYQVLSFLVENSLAENSRINGLMPWIAAFKNLLAFFRGLAHVLVLETGNRKLSSGTAMRQEIF